MRRMALTTAILMATSAAGVAATASAADISAPETITGTVQTLIREQSSGQSGGADIIRVLQVGDKTVALTDGSLTAVKDGATVSATAIPAADGAKEVLSSRTISAAAVPGEADATIPSVHNVYLALVRPQGISLAAATESAARAMVTKASEYWSAQTGTKVSFTTAQVQAYSSVYGCGNTYQDMWAEALAKMPAANGPGKHLVVVAPNNSGCAFGIASMGAVAATGNKVLVSGLYQSSLAHELGHNLGLYHSNSLRCSGTQDMPMVDKGFPGCQPQEYDDIFDVMGTSGTYFGMGNLNAVHLDGMKLLPGAVREVTATPGLTTARITPLSAPLSATTVSRTLKVTDPDGVNYFVEYRPDSGRDAVARSTGYNPSWGVRVLRDDPNAPASAGSYVLDATPTSYSLSDYNRVIPVGGTFTAASGKLTIQVTAQDATGATVSITIAKPPPPAAVTRVSDFNEDGRTDLVARDSAGQLWLYPGSGTGGFLPRQRMATGWNVFTAIVTPGDVTGDGNGDVLTRNAAGQLRLYPGNGTLGFTASRLVGAGGWNAMTALTAAGDLTGDARPDLLARDSAGRLWLYPMVGTGTFQTRRLTGSSGWNAMNAIMGAGDLSGDGKADLLARDSAGNLWLYRGNGTGALTARTSAGTGWQAMTALVTPGNWDLSGGNDLLARETSGTLWLYAGNNAGQVGAKRQIGSGFAGYTIA